jgi:hypothetical protein
MLVALVSIKYDNSSEVNDSVKKRGDIMRVWLTAVVMLVLSAAVARAEDKKEEPKAPDLPVKATLVAKKATYTLDLGGKSGDEFRRMLKEAEKGGKVPAGPKVDLVLELKNTSDKEVQVWISGDSVVLNLDLKGEGAVNVVAQQAFTDDFRGPKPITIAAGKTHEIPIASLTYGFRGVAQQAYWTEPGEYKLSASLQTAISPAPPGTKDNGQGFGPCTIKSEPVKITVEASK